MKEICYHIGEMKLRTCSKCEKPNDTKKSSWCRNCKSEYDRIYREKNREKILKRIQKWRKENRERHNGLNEGTRKRLKIEVLSYYSKSGIPECANPFGIHDKPFRDLRCLSLDHIKGDGTKLCKSLGIHRPGLYSWAKRNGYPEGLQVLCMNCQFIKRVENRECSKDK